MFDLKHLRDTDPEISQVLDRELSRQRGGIELIASENFVSEAVLEAMGSWLTNKYAEGYPGKRYYGGCQEVDVAENLARNRAKELFGADHANVQPHSGAQANMAVCTAVLSPGDTILGMNLAHGGHLTHGSPVNFSGKFYKIVPYGVSPETYTIDYEEVRRLAMEHKPKLIICGASAYPRFIDFKKFGEIAAECGAYLMADMAHIAGLVGAGLHPSPVPYADFVTSTTHKTLRGPRGGLILCKAKHTKMIDKSMFPGIQGGPLMHVIASKAVAFKEALDPSFKVYAAQIIKNAAKLAEGLIKRGFDLVSGGTDNHMMLVDLRKMGITGKDAERWLDDAGVTCNKNSVPFETQSPLITSGLRIGTPAVTTRGMVEEDMVTIANIIGDVIEAKGNASDDIKARVKTLADKYPLY